MAIIACMVGSLAIAVSGLALYWSWLAGRLRAGRPPRRYFIEFRRRAPR